MDDRPNPLVANSQTARNNLYQTYTRPDLSPKKKFKIIDSLELVDGYDLVFLINYILSLDTPGSLNIIGSDGSVLGVTFSRGFINQVDLPDKQVYFGRLLVEMGYVQQEELDLALKQSTSQIGQYFLDQRKVTQLQIDRTFRKQMQLRLTQLLGTELYKISFSETVENSLSYKVARRDYFDMCYRWLETRFDDAWLINHFSRWEDCRVTFIEGHTYAVDAFRKPLLMSLADFERHIRNGMTIRELKIAYADQWEMLLRALYLLHFVGALDFKNASESEVPKNVREEVRERLFKGEFIQAFQDLKKLCALHPYDESLRVALLWARVGHALESGVTENLATFESEVSSFSPELQSTGEISYIKSMISLLSKDSEKSENFYQEAIQRNSEFSKLSLNTGTLTRLFKFFS